MTGRGDSDLPRTVGKTTTVLLLAKSLQSCPTGAVQKVCRSTPGTESHLYGVRSPACSAGLLLHWQYLEVSFVSTGGCVM